MNIYVIEEELLGRVFCLFGIDLDLIKLLFDKVPDVVYIGSDLGRKLAYCACSLTCIAFDLLGIFVYHVDEIENLVQVETRFGCFLRKVCKLFCVKGHMVSPVFSLWKYFLRLAS